MVQKRIHIFVTGRVQGVFFRQSTKVMAIKNNGNQAMNKKQVFEFIKYYEKITKWMMKTMPSISDLTIYVDKNQKIKRLSKNKKYDY